MNNTAEPFDAARLNAYAAPGVNRWLDDAPSRTLDKHLSSTELTTQVKLTLGVDVADGKSLCRFCAAVLDTKGVHPCSCTAGGDVVSRHNQGRDKIFRWALRGRLNPELEKAGILNEPAVMINSLRRPADVLVDDPTNQCDKVALDIKVINALGPEHLADTRSRSLAAADAYRLQAMEFQDTANRCAQRGVRYEPLVFCCQGGIQSNAESILTRLAGAVAKAEGRDASQVKADIIKDLSRTWVRASASCISRRGPRMDEVDAAVERLTQGAEILET